MSHHKPGAYQYFSMLHKRHQNPLAQGLESLPFASHFLLRIESHCYSVRDKSRCVLALPAAASIATGAFAVSSMGRVI